ncbi:MAG: hypothetical protein PHD01_09100 [Geobacteraceae bacterium]|nr:hypothetical protein [Geobacteraceae bacterium]
MNEPELNFTIPTLGKCTVQSPMKGVRFVTDDDRMLYDSHSSKVMQCLEQGKQLPTMELAGPREKIYFDPSKLKCGIVTCGGICPGVNDVIRALVMSLSTTTG